MPPNDLNAAGPIEVTATPEAAPAPAAAAPSPVATHAAAPEPASLSAAGPPGLTKRASPRPQQEAVVLPGSQPSAASVGVQFGSLSLFDGQPAEVPKQAEQAQTFQASAPAPEPVQAPAPVQSQPQQAEQAVQTSAFAPQNNNLFQQQEQQTSFTQRFGGYDQPAQQQASAPQAPSPYAPFRPEAAYGQQQQAPVQQQQQQHSAYAAFGQPQHQPQAPGQQQTQQGFSAQPDYSSLYGQDSFASQNYYNQQFQAPGSGFQQPQALPAQAGRAEDATSAPSPAPQPQPQQAPPQQAYGYPGYYQPQQHVSLSIPISGLPAGLW